MHLHEENGDESTFCVALKKKEKGNMVFPNFYLKLKEII